VRLASSYRPPTLPPSLELQVSATPISEELGMVLGSETLPAGVED
jgi:hypothetical protein